MATITNTNDGNIIIDFDDHYVKVPADYLILNPEMIPDAKCAWVCALRHHDDELPNHAIWLEDGIYASKKDPSEQSVLQVYFDKTKATPEQKERFYYGAYLLDALCRNITPDLSKEYSSNKCNTLGIWPITQQSIAREFYFTKFGGEEVA
jgi:hypothetical protein